MQQDVYPWTISWKLVQKSNGGGIAVITNSNTCYGTSGDTNGNGIPDDAEIFGGGLAIESIRLYGEEGKQTLGEIHGDSIANYVINYPVHNNLWHSKSVQEYVLLGDPSLKIGGYSS